MFTAQSRYGRDPAIVTRTRTWSDPIRWQAEASRENKQIRVFTCSWSDWFHADADAWRAEAWQIVKSCPNLTFQILTKRADRIAAALPPDWGAGWPNVWLGVSVSEPKGLWRVDALRKIPAVVRFISYEPALADITSWLFLEGIHWVIFGGESGPGYRAPIGWQDWARTTRDLCRLNRAAFFFKQSPAARTEMGTQLDGATVRQFPDTDSTD
jgi:protein gp37